MALLGDTINAPAVTRLWDAALDTPPADDRRWLHGDLHPANIVVDEGKLVAVIDWVDVSAGDRAYDLAAAWLCFPHDPADRAAFVDATGVDDAATWERARACALNHALACLASSADNERARCSATPADTLRELCLTQFAQVRGGRLGARRSRA